MCFFLLEFELRDFMYARWVHTFSLEYFLEIFNVNIYTYTHTHMFYTVISEIIWCISFSTPIWLGPIVQPPGFHSHFFPDSAILCKHDFSHIILLNVLTAFLPDFLPMNSKWCQTWFKAFHLDFPFAFHCSPRCSWWHSASLVTLQSLADVSCLCAKCSLPAGVYHLSIS